MNIGCIYINYCMNCISKLTKVNSGIDPARMFVSRDNITGNNKGRGVNTKLSYNGLLILLTFMTTFNDEYVNKEKRLISVAIDWLKL